MSLFVSIPKPQLFAISYSKNTENSFKEHSSYFRKRISFESEKDSDSQTLVFQFSQSDSQFQISPTKECNACSIDFQIWPQKIIDLEFASILKTNFDKIINGLNVLEFKREE